MTDELTSSASVLFAPDHVIEVRVITDDGMASGYFDSHQELAEKVSVLDGVLNVQGIYVTLNEVNPSLLSRRANRIKMRLSKKDATTADADIIRRRWFPVDIDPVRPSGVSSTEEEHQAAIGMAVKVATFLREDHGWPRPVLADSGNGAHLLYRIDLQNDPGSHDLVKHGLETLSVMFSDRVATIDTANHNAARIWKLYGTVSRKGDNTKIRPHRRARIIDVPELVEVVSLAQLERLAGALPVAPAAPPAARGRPGRTLDLPKWLSDHGLGVTNEKEIKGGTLYSLDECPFSSAHKDGAFAIQFASGGIFAGCHHATCGGSGVQHWDELRDRYEPAAERKNSSNPRTPPAGPPPAGPPPAPAFSRMEGVGEATTILQHGDPKGGMLRAFALDHEGDETAAECLLLSLASRSVTNTNGLHVSVTGESGKGKSHTFTTMLKQVPERFRISGAMSNKALFYMDGLVPGMAIVLDDTSLSEDMAEILKGVTTGFQTPFLYRTVNKDRKGQVCVIPERCTWWVAKVEGSGDDQVFNRMLTCWIDDSSEQDRRVLERVLDQSQALPQTPGERPQVMVCRAMWELIGAERLYVVIPFAKKIKFQATGNRRNPEMLLDLIKSNAVIRFKQRERVDIEGMPCIAATREDFNDAVKLYSLLNGKTGGQATKLTKKESDLVATIEKEKWPEFTISMLQKATGLSNGSIHKLMHGYGNRGASYSGLLEKCPAIAYTDRTVLSGDEYSGVTVRRRSHAYTFDQDLFRAWSSGGAVWIDDDVSNGDGDDVNPATGGASPASPLQVESESSSTPDSDTAGDSSFVGVTPLHQSCNRVAGFVNDNLPADLQTASTHTHLDIIDPLSCNQFDLMGPHKNETDHSGHTLCDPEHVAGLHQESDQQAPTTEPGPHESGKGLQQVLQHVAGVQHKSYQNAPMAEPIPPEPGSALQPMLQDTAKISSPDFKPIGYHETHTTCAACGRKGTDYIEKATPARESRKDKLAVRICKKCFEMSQRKEQTRAPPLPGIIVLSRMVRISKDIGRCTVCNLGKAMFIDKEATVHLCQQCYEREARAVGPVKGGAGP
ncbi:MAG: hypothetical protein NTV68_13805 [Methanomicrobiales archaeon]|nr:hypothetical protein [Methanomicrobiales archaeon]